MSRSGYNDTFNHFSEAASMSYWARNPTLAHEHASQLRRDLDELARIPPTGDKGLDVDAEIEGKLRKRVEKLKGKKVWVPKVGDKFTVRAWADYENGLKCNESMKKHCGNVLTVLDILRPTGNIQSTEIGFIWPISQCDPVSADEPSADEGWKEATGTGEFNPIHVGQAGETARIWDGKAIVYLGLDGLREGTTDTRYATWGELKAANGW